MNVLITGGAGFIGTNAAMHHLTKGDEVTILDNFSRKGTDINIEFIKKVNPRISIISGDVRDSSLLKKVVEKNDVVIHLAGQVAVTSSLQDPRNDFECNALGTFNVLEASRQASQKPIVLLSSTNKVYGDVQGDVRKEERRYVDYLHKNGVSESEPLNFHSPYGCSKGAADQYTRDYARIYDVPTVVFRQSCIYGDHQFGVEDQGWVAHFMIRSFLQQGVTVYGTGMQVRDLLYVDDLLGVYDKAIAQIDKVKGEVFNIGGGFENTLSILELLDIIDKEGKLSVKYADKRPGDQDVYISDNSKAQEYLDWTPRISVRDGLGRLYKWIESNKEHVAAFL